MNKGREITRGKTKVLYELEGQPDVVVVQQMDGITAGDGARRDVIPGKGRLAAQTTARVMRLLNLCGLPTHYLSGGEDDDDNEMLVRRAQMIPLEVVVRGVAAGSLVKRRPGIARGTLLVPRLIEYFLKDDANHDPQIDGDAIVGNGVATPAELATMTELARITYEILAHAWRRRDALLVDLKVEFGRLSSGEGKGQLVLADVIDNDSWRVWPQGREDLMLDKQRYRNLETVTDEALAQVRVNYEQVADLVGTFPTMRPGMVAIMADGPSYNETLARVAHDVGRYGLPSVRHITSAARAPGYALQQVTQLDATFSRIVYVAVGAPAAPLADLIEHATPNPVLRVDARSGPDDELGIAIAKTFALDDTVVFGRVLLLQSGARSAVLQADASLNAATAPTGAALA